jgi:hypothetical protein
MNLVRHSPLLFSRRLGKVDLGRFFSGIPSVDDYLRWYSGGTTILSKFRDEAWVKNPRKSQFNTSKIWRKIFYLSKSVFENSNCQNRAKEIGKNHDGGATEGVVLFWNLWDLTERAGFELQDY